MFSSAKMAGLTAGRNLTSGTHCMAHRKGLVTARVGAALAFILLLAVAMTGRVLMLNQMAAMRADIAVLQDQKDFLETSNAALQERWNRETSAEVICARAHRELGLISPEAPGLVLVKLPGAASHSRWGWPDWLPGLAGGDPAMAEGLKPMTGSGQMVHLDPVRTAGNGSSR